jgi:hypothetical protein
MQIKTKMEKQRRRAEEEEAETLRAGDGDEETLRARDGETVRAGDWRGCELGFRAATGCAAVAKTGDRGVS